MPICEYCKAEHPGTYASGRFCNAKCSRTFAVKGLSPERQREINEKRSKALKFVTEADLTGNCKWCGKIFVGSKKSQECCSLVCGNKYGKSQMTKEQLDAVSSKMREIALRRHAAGDGIGWKSRDRIAGSYPEQFFSKAFELKGIIAEREARVGKWFADFLIGRQVLEIDGRHHDDDDRKKIDAEKDAYLLSNGYTVTRIRWMNPKTKRGLAVMMEQFEEFIRGLK